MRVPDPFGLHPDGFGGQMPRTPTQTRHHLQQPHPADLLATMERRLGVAVPRGPVLDVSRVTMPRRSSRR